MNNTASHVQFTPPLSFINNYYTLTLTHPLSHFAIITHSLPYLYILMRPNPSPHLHIRQYSLTHSHTHTHSPTHTHSLTHSLVHSLPCSLTLSNPLMEGDPVFGSLPPALRCMGGEGLGLGFMRSLDTRSTLRNGNLRLEPMTGELDISAWFWDKMARRMALTATYTGRGGEGRGGEGRGGKFITHSQFSRLGTRCS